MIHSGNYFFEGECTQESVGAVVNAVNSFISSITPVEQKTGRSLQFIKEKVDNKRFDVPSQVINKLFDSGYEEQIIDIVQEFENDNTREVSYIPLSPTMIQDSGEQIILSPSVY